MAVLAPLVFLGGCGQEPAQEAPVARPVKIVTIGDVEQGSAREYPGAIRATQHADLSFEVPGRIVERMVNEGDRVTEGQILARLDDRDFQANLDRAAAGLRKAQADLDRSLRIYAEDPGAISTSKIDSDRKGVEVAETEVRKAAKAVEDTELRAPFDGLVARRLVEDFQNVPAKQPVMILQDISELEIEVSLPERDVTGGRINQTAEEITQRVQPRVQVSALPDRDFTARISEFATTADPATRTFQVRFVFEPPEDVTILPGMTARVTVRRLGQDAIRLPSHAVFADEQGAPQVWLVHPSTMKVSMKPVQVGVATGEQVEILGGLSAGDHVATSGVSQLREGMEVRPFSL